MNLIANDVAIAFIFVVTGWMLKTWLGHKEAMKQLSSTKQDLASSDHRLQRVEQAIESVAIEVERISEGQRFVTKLLNERAQPPAAVAAASTYTGTPR